MSSANALEILITARDNASKSLAVISTNVGEIGKQSDISATKIDNFGSKLANLANNDIPAKLQQISSSIVNIGQKTPVVLAGLGASLITVSSAIQGNVIAIELFKNAIASLESDLIGAKRSLNDIKDTLLETIKVFGGLEASGLAIGQSLTNGINNAVKKPLKGIDSLLDAVEKRVDSLKNVAKFSGYIQEATLSSSNIQGGEEVGKLLEESKKLLGVLGSLGQEVFFLTAGFQQIASVFSGPYEAFIGQNVRLQGILLQTQSQIVSTNKVIKNGIELTNVTDAIRSLGESSKQTINEIRISALKLVGLVSNDLIQEILPAVTQNISQLGGKLGDVPKLVTSIGAALTTLGIPLFEARESISLIASGTITVENRLARSLNITNQQIGLWKSQGTLIDNLTKRLQPFVEGNALAATQITNVVSNLKEAFQLVTQKAGETFLDPIVKRLNDAFALIDPSSSDGLKNFKVIQDVVSGIAQNIFNGILKLADGIGALLKSITPAIVGLVQVGAKTIGDLIGFVGDTFTRLANGPLKYLFAALGSLSQYAEAFTGIFKLGLLLKIREVLFGLAVGGLGLLIKTLPVVSTLFGLFALRSNEAVRSLVNLQSASNTSFASLLTLGKNINSIPGGVQEIAKAFPLFGQSLAQVLPQISQFGIALIALGKKFPLFGSILSSLDVQIPKIVANLARMAIAFIETSEAALNAGKSLGVFGTVGAGLNTVPIIAGLKALTAETKLTDIAVNTVRKSVGTLRGTIVSSFLSFAASSALFYGVLQLFEKFQPVLEEIGKALKPFTDAFLLTGQLIVQTIQQYILPNLGYVTAAVLVLATTISQKLFIAIAATIATQITGWFIGLASVLGAFTGATVVATGGVSALAVALEAVKGASGSIDALKIAFLQLGPIIAEALLPLLAIAATIATIGILARGIIQDDEIKAINANTGQAQNADNTNFALLGRARKAKEEETKATAQGLKLTKEQYAENEKLQKQIEGQTSSEKQRLAGLENQLNSFKGGDAERAAQQDLVNKAKDSIKKLEESVSGIAIAAKDLPQYGSALQQFARNVDNAKKSLANSSGDPSVFAKQIEALLEGSKQLQESGLINADEAAKTYASIATNASVDAATQIKAQQAITEAYKIESQKRIDVYDTQTKRIQALVATGKISEAEAITQTTTVTLNKLTEERDAINKAYLKRKEITEKTTQDTVTAAKKDQAIADLKIQAAKGDPTKFAEFKEGQLADIDKEKKALDDKRKAAEAELKSLNDTAVPTGGRSIKATKEIEDAAQKVKELQEQLEKLDKSRDVLDKTIKVDKNAVKDIKDLPQQIEEGKKKLIELEQAKAVTDKKLAANQATYKARSNNSATFGTVFTTEEQAERKRIQDAAKQAQDELDKQKALIDSQSAKLADAKTALIPDAKKEKNALGEKQLAFDAQNKALSAKELFNAEEKRKRDKALDDSILEAKKELATAQIKILDQQIKTALDKEKLGETQRLGELAKLRKSGIKLESEIRLLETGEKKKQIQTELELQKQKFAQFAVLEKKGVGVNQADKLATQTKIAELTKSLTDTELEAINNLTAAIRDHLTLAANQYGVAIEKGNLKLERQKLLYTALEKSLENQARLADSSKKLSDSIVAVREADLNVLTKIYDKQQQAIRGAGGTGNFADLQLEEKKKILLEQMAKIKFESLLRQQTFEKESLEREIQKRDLLLERQKLENKMKTESAKVDLAIAQVDVKAAEAEVKLRPNSPEAKLKLDKARLEQQKKEIGFAGLVQEGGFLNETGRINGIQAGQERTSLDNNQSAALLSGQGEFIGSIRNDAKREQLLARFELQLRGRNGPQQELTGAQIEELLSRRPSQAQGASLTDPSKYGDVLKRTTANGTLTTEPVKPTDKSFATSFDELNKKYAPTNGLGGIEDLNKKYGGKNPQTFEELNAKYSGKPVTEEGATGAIASSFDSLNKQINDGFTKTLVAPQMKVDEMTTGLEAQFDKISKQIVENPVQLKIDEKQLEDQLKKFEKPIAVLDEKQLQRLEAIATALGVGGQNVNPQTAQNAAAGIGTTINAPITVNQQGGVGNVSGVDIKAGVADALNTILKRVAGVTGGTK